MSSRSLLLSLCWFPIALVGCLSPDEPGNLVPKTVAEDASLPRIGVNGTLLHAETFGDPTHPVVMVLHGGPGADYRGLLPLRALADDGYYVVFWDQRGSGLSQRHDADDELLDLMVEDLRQVIDRFDSGPMVLIGHSWGAMYATLFINTYGSYDGRIQGAVLSEPGAFTTKQLESLMADLFGSISFFSEELNDVTWAGQILTPADHERADYAFMIESANCQPAVGCAPDNKAPMFRLGAVSYAKSLAIVSAEDFDWTTNLAAFSPAVLFLRGDLNETMPLDHQIELASNFPNASIVTIPDVGHEMIWERPADYMQQVRIYFQQIGFTGGTP